jgi:hypothetical protein
MNRMILLSIKAGALGLGGFILLSDLLSAVVTSAPSRPARLRRICSGRIRIGGHGGGARAIAQ